MNMRFLKPAKCLSIQFMDESLFDQFQAVIGLLNLEYPVKTE